MNKHEKQYLNFFLIKSIPFSSIIYLSSGSMRVFREIQGLVAVKNCGRMMLEQVSADKGKAKV